MITRRAGAVPMLLLLGPAASGQLAQQGGKLVGAGAVGQAAQGTSVAVAGDGSTLLIGGPQDDAGAGAVWAFTRVDGVWSQQGDKLVGSGAAGGAFQGISVALAADGGTAVVGGPRDDSGAGAAWILTRAGAGWAQQGGKLVGSGAVGHAYQGASVAISADGNTAVVGGFRDNGGAGAAWVFTRSGGGWSQQGDKLVGTGAVGLAQQGCAVAVSGDGDTLVVGGPNDNSGSGAAWVFARRDGRWSQQGAKLVGTGAQGPAYEGVASADAAGDVIAPAQQGAALAIAGDGSALIVGGPADTAYLGLPGEASRGAVWIFTRGGGVWSQQGGKLFGAGGTGPGLQGTSVAMSGDGSLAVIGGPGDSSYAGAAWALRRAAGAWAQLGDKLVGQDRVGSAWQGAAAAISSDGSTVVVGGSGDDAGAGAAWAYVAAGCQAPLVTGQPEDEVVASGQPATLAVTAAGTSPLHYRWFQGLVGDESAPVGTDAPALTTPPLEDTATFWVEIANACGAATSGNATVTVARGVRRHLGRVPPE